MQETCSTMKFFMNKAKIMQLILFFVSQKTKFYFNSLQFKFHNATFFRASSQDQEGFHELVDS